MMSQQSQAVGFRPLYQQVKQKLVENLIEGLWAPGAALPSEHQLAASLGVSPGTVRKALDEMAAENMVVRRQGRGTYVAEHDQDRVLFQYFMLTRDDGRRELPDSTLISMTRCVADAEERARLGLAARSSVWRIERCRTVEGRNIIAERIVISARLFPGLDRLEDIPNNVYQLFATQFGISIARAEERLKAVAASADEAKMLAIKAGTPLLEIDRTAYALDGKPVEWRISRCLTDDFHYLSNLR